MKALIQLLKEYPIMKSEIVNQLPTFTGDAFRVETGLVNAPEKTIKDIIEYEELQLGKKLNVHPEVKKELNKFSARQAVWITKKEEDAKKYGFEVQRINVGKNAKIIAQDDEGGYLVVFGRRPGRDYPEE